MTSENRYARPLPWRQWGLALLPGLAALAVAGVLPGRSPGRSSEPLFGTVVVVGLCGVLAGLGLLRDRRVSAWSLGALGVLLAAVLLVATSLLAGTDISSVIWPLLAWAGIVHYLAGHDLPRGAWFLLCLLLGSSALSLALTALADPERARAVLQSTAGLELWWTAMLLIPVAAGLPLARHHGLAAGLVVVAAEFLVVAEMLNPIRDVSAWSAGQAARRVMASMPAACFLLAPAAWFFRARSARARLAALVVPASIGLAAGLALHAGLLSGTGSQLLWPTAIGSVQVGLAVGIAAIAYRSMERRV